MHRVQRKASAVILVALLVTALLVPLSSLDAAAIWMDSTPATAYMTNVFNDTRVATVSIDMSASDWQWLLDNATQEEFRSCDITIGGTTYYSVGIRPKGNSSLARVASSTSDRFSFKIKFDEYIPGQTCYGLRALVLNNVMDDATYMKEYLSYKLFRDMGIATPAFSYASITVNGKPWGLYLMVEVIDSSFAQRNYGTTSGNLYKPESVDVGARGKFVADQADDQPAVQDGARVQGAGGMRGAGGTSLVHTSDAVSDYNVLRDSAVLSTTDDQDFQKLITMMKALKDGTGIEETLDVDEVLRYFAVNTFLVNLDSYASSLKHNYYLYEQDGVFQILPWDLNLSFAGFQAGSAAGAINFPIDTPVSDTMDNSPLIASLLTVDEYKELYHSYLQQLVVQQIRSGAFETEVARVNALIAGAVKSDATAFVTYEQYQASLPMLVQFAQDRSSSIMAQLAGQQPNTTTGTVATTVNLATLGSQAGGGNMGAPGQAGAAPNAAGQPDGAAPVGGVFGGAQADRTVMQQVLAIIRAADPSGLTDEQTAQLTALGLDSAAIERLQQMPTAGQRPNMPADAAQAVPGNVAQSTSGSVLPLVVVTGAGLLLLAAGIAFVARFRNRRYLLPA